MLRWKYDPFEVRIMRQGARSRFQRAQLQCMSNTRIKCACLTRNAVFVSPIRAQHAGDRVVNSFFRCTSSIEIQEFDQSLQSDALLPGVALLAGLEKNGKIDIE